MDRSTNQNKKGISNAEQKSSISTLAKRLVEDIVESKLEIKDSVYAAAAAVSVNCLCLADLCEKYTPAHFQNIIQYYESPNIINGELMFILIYIIAIESGFISVTEYVKCHSLITELPSTTSYHSKNVQLISNYVPTYEQNTAENFFSITLQTIYAAASNNADTSILKSSLTAFLTGEDILISLSALDATHIVGRSVYLSVQRYVIADSFGKPWHLRFAKLSELTHLLRNKLFVPLRNDQISYLGAHMFPSLLGLPNEIYKDIFKHLNKRDMNALALTNHYLHDIVKYNETVKKKD